MMRNGFTIKSEDIVILKLCSNEKDKRENKNTMFDHLV